MNNIHFSHLLEDHPVLIVPGLHNSDAYHWQSLWQQQLPGSRRIDLNDWHTPNLDGWKAAIRHQLNALYGQQQKPVLIIAHSFGTLASASIAAETPEQIAALLLVAPADPDKFNLAPQLPQQPLRVPAKIIASSNDPWLSDTKAAYWALQWGTDFLRLKNVGHINSESGLGHWPEGVQQLHQLLRKAKQENRAMQRREKSFQAA